MEDVNKRRRISFSLSKVDCAPQEINSRKIRRLAIWNKRDKIHFKSDVFATVAVLDAREFKIPGRRRRQNVAEEAVSLKAFHSISNSTKLLPYIVTINTTIHPNNEIAVRMRKLFILLPFPAFHCNLVPRVFSLSSPAAAILESEKTLGTRLAQSCHLFIDHAHS